jgi:hypothetical protein
VRKIRKENKGKDGMGVKRVQEHAYLLPSPLPSRVVVSLSVAAVYLGNFGDKRVIGVAILTKAMAPSKVRGNVVTHIGVN